MSYDLKDPVALSTGVTDGSQFFGALSEEAPLPSAFLASALWEYVTGKIVGTYPVFFPTTGIPDNDVGVDGSVAIDYAAGLSYVKEAGAWGGATAMRLRPRGAYGGATAYLVGDVVTDQSASWVNLAASTGVAPPTLPTETSATWALVAKSSEVEAEAAIAAAEAARDAAEAARDAAFANASVYADIATGRAAVADGAQFMIVSGDEIIRYRRDTSSTQTEMARYPTVSFLRGGLADRFTEGSGTISPSVYIAYSFVSGTTYIIDVLARHGERALLNIFTDIGPGLNVTVDLRTAFVGGGVSVTPMSDGFSLVRIVFTTAATGSSNLQLRLCDGSGSTTYTGDGASGLWVAECAIRTEYNGANLLSSGRDFTAWTKVSTTVTADSVPAVGPIETAIGAAISAERSLALLIGDSAVNRVTETSGSVYPSVYKTVGWTSGQQYIVEVIAKAGERARLNLYCNNGCTFDVTFDLESGAVESGTGGVIEPRGDGYYLCRVTKTASATASGNLQVRVYPATGGQPYTGDGASGLYVRSADLRTSAGGASIITDFKAWTKENCTLTTGAAPYPGLQSVAYEAIARAYGAGTQHPLYGLDVSIVGTSLVAQLLMPNAFAAATGCVLQSLGSSGGSLGLDARGSPHYGSGAVTALLPSINAGADVIILDMLVNDVAAADVPLGVITDTTTATYYGALANFFTWCETNRPNAAVAVVVQTAASAAISPSDYTHGHANANGAYLEDFQEATRRACRYHGRPFIDPSVFGVGFRDAGDDTSDGLHWDTSGAVRIARIYAAEARRLADAGWI